MAVKDAAAIYRAWEEKVGRRDSLRGESAQLSEAIRQLEAEDANRHATLLANEKRMMNGDVPRMQVEGEATQLKAVTTKLRHLRAQQEKLDKQIEVLDRETAQERDEAHEAAESLRKGFREAHELAVKKIALALAALVEANAAEEAAAMVAIRFDGDRMTRYMRRLAFMPNDIGQRGSLHSRVRAAFKEAIEAGYGVADEARALGFDDLLS